MIKSIYLTEGQPVEINTSMGWVLRYRETFGNDILPDLLPILEAVILAAVELIDESEDGKLSMQAAVDSIKEGGLIGAMSMLAGLEVKTALQIIWSMMKEADEPNVPGFDAWARSIDRVPFDEVGPVIFWAIADNFVSKKNMDKLRNGLGAKKEPEAPKNTSTSTPSSPAQ